LLAPGVRIRDLSFHSTALGRQMQYRVLLPEAARPDRKLPVVFLLHGAGEDFLSWSNHSDVARYAADGLILVMPEGDYSYYINSAVRPQNRYEDYIARDLLTEVESRLPVATDRAHRAIVGVSMGGFGAVTIALRHPKLFRFVGGLSAALDAPRRPITIRRPRQSWAFLTIFGFAGSETRRQVDPFLAAQAASPIEAPYLFLACGDQDYLLPVNNEFDAFLSRRNLPHEFHVGRGGHEWGFWNAQLPALFAKLRQYVAN
jgi:S-formylglutathione hydrolase FrmB